MMTGRGELSLRPIFPINETTLKWKHQMQSARGMGIKFEQTGSVILRYGLVIILLWVGALRFTAYEAEGIKGIVKNSPLTSWAYSLLGLQGIARVIGIIEIVLGLMIGSRNFSPKLSVLGSTGPIVMFIVTLSFSLTTPGVWQPGYGFPYPSPIPGQFLAKDLLLLGAAVWTAGEALSATSSE